MKKVKVLHYDAFTSSPNKGNPAGIVFDADKLTEEEMLDVARKVGFNETSFVLPSKNADIRIRFFTPGHEMDLCGHATIATLFALAKQNKFGPIDDTLELTQETKAGILPIRIDCGKDGSTIITMKQAPAQFVPFTGSVDDLATSIGLHASEIDDSLPIVYGSTGIWTVLIPIKKLESFQRMVPHNHMFPAVLQQIPRASLHPFCLETYDPAAHMHGRHFSSPYSGTVEDAVTGTASGVMGAYYAKYISPGKQPFQLEVITVEQGQEIGRDGRVTVVVKRNGDQYDVNIAGTAVYVKEYEVEI